MRGLPFASQTAWSLVLRPPLVRANYITTTTDDNSPVLASPPLFGTVRSKCPSASTRPRTSLAGKSNSRSPAPGKSSSSFLPITTSSIGCHRNQNQIDTRRTSIRAQISAV